MESTLNRTISESLRVMSFSKNVHFVTNLPMGNWIICLNCIYRLGEEHIFVIDVGVKDHGMILKWLWEDLPFMMLCKMLLLQLLRIVVVHRRVFNTFQMLIHPPPPHHHPLYPWVTTDTKTLVST